MATREYIGARYVPLICGTWDSTLAYEPLSVVLYEGNSYTSRMYVPAGIDITNEDYWAETGNYDAQVEAYRTEVTNYTSTVAELQEQLEENTSTLDDFVENFNYKVQNALAGSVYIGSDNFTELGTLSIKSSSYMVQGAEVDYENNYIYTYEEVSDTGYIRRYTLDTLEYVDELSMGSGIHGNSLSIAPNDMLMLCDSVSKSLYFISKDTLELKSTHTTTYNMPSSATFMDTYDTLIFQAGSTPGIMAIYGLNPLYDNSYSPFAVINDVQPKRGMLAQDICAASGFIFSLYTGYVDSSETYHDFIRVTSIQGNVYGDIYLPNNNTEYEGITIDTDNSLFYIIDRYGTVYTAAYDSSIFTDSYSGYNNANNLNLRITPYVSTSNGIMRTVTDSNSTDWHFMYQFAIALPEPFKDYNITHRITSDYQIDSFNAFSRVGYWAMSGVSSTVYNAHVPYMTDSNLAMLEFTYAFDEDTFIWTLSKLRYTGITSSLNFISFYYDVDEDDPDTAIENFVNSLTISPSTTYAFPRSVRNGGYGNCYVGDLVTVPE